MTSDAEPRHDDSWWRRAACAGMDRRLFFAAAGDGGGLRSYVSARQALAACGRCEVRVECLRYALSVESPGYRHGIWGGTTPQQRDTLGHARRGPQDAL